MYLHLGQDIIVPQADIIGIYDLDNCSASHITREFLAKAERAGEVVGIAAQELPRSFVLVKDGGKSTVYLSQLSTATLQKRSAAGFEISTATS